MSAFDEKTTLVYNMLEFKLFDNGLKLDISNYSHMNIRMSTKGKRPLRSLTPSDKIHAIQRIHDGESKASVARDIGVPESTLRGWCKNEDKLRFMSRQSMTDKLSADSIADKLGSSSGLIGGPPEKRQKLDTSLPLNFSSKLKYDELVYKRTPLNGLDYSANKSLPELGFNSLPPDYVTFNGGMKNKVFGADISRQSDPSMMAISPLSSLTHLSGLTGLSQSPLAISFNELTSNLNLLAQLNPGLAAMSGLNGLAATASTLRNVKPKAQPQIHSPCSESGDRQQGLTVKTWAKQKTPTPASSDNNFGLNLSQSDSKNKMKCPSPSLAPSLGSNQPQLTAIPDDPLLYWLKSQQAMLGLNNLYPPPAPIAATSPPIRSSTPQHSGQQTNTPPIASTPLTPSSTPSASLDDKNAAWYNWCKAFGASLSTLVPAAAAAINASPLPQQPAPSASVERSSSPNDSNEKPPFDNILFSQLTKDTGSSSVQSSSSTNHMNNNEISSNTDSTGKPEDLSAKLEKASPVPSSPPTPTQSLAASPREQQLVPTPTHSPGENSVADVASTTDNACAVGNSVSDCKDVLDNLLYKINNNPNVSGSVECSSESDASYNSEPNHNNNDENTSNNNNHSNKTDEEERTKCTEFSKDEDTEAIKHGEKFLQWLENCSNPRVTSVQLMQLRFLISAIKSGSDPKLSAGESNSTLSEAIAEVEDTIEESGRNKARRRK